MSGFTEIKPESKSNITKTILIIIFTFLGLTIVGGVYYWKGDNNKITNMLFSKNESSSNTVEKNGSINIVVNKKDSDIETESPSENLNSTINKVDSTDFNKTSESLITTDITLPPFPSSNHRNNNNKKNNHNNIIELNKNNDTNDINESSSEQQTKPELQLQQLEQQLQQQEFQLEQQLQQIKMMKNKLHQYQGAPSSLSSDHKSDEKLKEKEKHILQDNQLPLNINQNASITFSYNIIPINTINRNISNNNNHESPNYPSTIDYDESPPSYNDVVNS